VVGPALPRPSAVGRGQCAPVDALARRPVAGTRVRRHTPATATPRLRRLSPMHATATVCCRCDRVESRRGSSGRGRRPYLGFIAALSAAVLAGTRTRLADEADVDLAFDIGPDDRIRASPVARPAIASATKGSRGPARNGTVALAEPAVGRRGAGRSRGSGRPTGGPPLLNSRGCSHAADTPARLCLRGALQARGPWRPRGAVRRHVCALAHIGGRGGGSRSLSSESAATRLADSTTGPARSATGAASCPRGPTAAPSDAAAREPPCRSLAESSSVRGARRSGGCGGISGWQAPGLGERS
jgi:hypothetical protein